VRVVDTYSVLKCCFVDISLVGGGLFVLTLFTGRNILMGQLVTKILGSFFPVFGLSRESSCFLSFFLGSRRPDLSTGLSGGQAPD